jgi:hypothetical protein
MAFQVEEAKCVQGFRESKSAVIVQRRFRTVFGRNPATKYQFTTGTNCLIGLDASVNEQVPVRRPVTEAQVHDV